LLLALLVTVLAVWAGLVIFRDKQPRTVRKEEPPHPGPRQVIVGKDGAQMVYVPDGVFFIGDDKGRPEERPRMRVFLEAYYIDRFEISNELFARFIKETGYRPEKGSSTRRKEKRLPARHLTWKDVDSYCRWAGKRMPTEYEWEKAARGIDDRKWPWGNDRKKAGGDTASGTPEMLEVYDDPAGQSPYGCMHMADNVWEWIDDWFIGYVLNPEPDPRYGETYRVLRGGIDYDGEEVKYSPVTRRHYLKPDEATPFTGGRCARDP